MAHRGALFLHKTEKEKHLPGAHLSLESQAIQGVHGHPVMNDMH